MRSLVVALVALRAMATEVTPIEQVLNMLKDLQTQVVTEGKTEAKAYDKFACFCKDATNEKEEAITDGQNTIDTLVGKINSLNSDRDACVDRISEYNKRIGVLEKEMEAETKENEIQIQLYLEEKKKAQDNIGGVETAIHEIEVGSGVPERPSMKAIALKKHLQKVRESLQLADTMGISHPHDHEALAALMLQMDSKQPAQPGYVANEDLGEVLGTMNALDKDFTNQKSDIDIEEGRRVNSYDMFIQQRTDEKKSCLKNIQKQKEMIGQKSADIAENNEALTQAQATLRDDQAYVKDLIEKCNNKADEWDQRTQMRQDELTALTTAIQIITDRVKTQAEKTNMKRFIQVSAHTTKVEKTASNDEAGALLDQAGKLLDESEDASQKTVLLQLNQPRNQMKKLLAFVKAASKDKHDEEAKIYEGLRTEHHEEKGVHKHRAAIITKHRKHHQASPTQDAEAEADPVRRKVMDLLRTKGRQLKSMMLTTLAGQVAADPFGKIKTLISELIGRLNQEAADEADHKGWCDKSINEAKSTRDDKAEKIAFLNTLLERKEIARDKTTDRLNILKAEISDLEDVKAKFTKARADEKAENESSIKEAKEGISAVNDALKVLKEFYNAAKDGGKVSLAQQDPKKADDLPDTGFGGDYKGSQSASTGIIGMMEVILGDFERTIKITKQEEDKASRDFRDLERSTDISIETKTSEKNDKESENAETKSKIDQAVSDLESNQELLDKALQELIELQPACIDTGMTYEERVAKREQEIESLKGALCLLEKNGPVKEDTMTCPDDIEE